MFIIIGFFARLQMTRSLQSSTPEGGEWFPMADSVCSFGRICEVVSLCFLFFFFFDNFPCGFSITAKIGKKTVGETAIFTQQLFLLISIFPLWNSMNNNCRLANDPHLTQPHSWCDSQIILEFFKIIIYVCLKLSSHTQTQ